MDPKDLVAGLPESARVIDSPRGVLVVRDDLAQAFLAVGYAPGDVPRPARSAARGKRPLGEVRADGRAYLVRRFHHGGLLRWLTGDRFASAVRPFDEWRLQLRLRALGVDTPEVVAARAQRVFPVGWRLDLATESVEGASDLGALLARRRDGRLADGPWRRLLAAAGALLARLHGLGFEHADLTPRNLLAQDVERGKAGPRLWVIDLDGSRLGRGALDEEQARANLARLARHLARMAGEHGAGLSRADGARFLRAYAPDRDRRRALARALAARRTGALHRLGWGLERRLGRGRGAAEAHLRRGPARG